MNSKTFSSSDPFPWQGATPRPALRRLAHTGGKLERGQNRGWGEVRWGGGGVVWRISAPFVTDDVMSCVAPSRLILSEYKRVNRADSEPTRVGMKLTGLEELILAEAEQAVGWNYGPYEPGLYEKQVRVTRRRP